MSTFASGLKAKIERRECSLGILGLGHIGLPLALAFAGNGFHVTGFDRDEDRVAALNAGRSYINYIDCSMIQQWRKANRLEAALDFLQLSSIDVIIICLPTPLGPNQEPDLRNIIDGVRQIRETLHPGQLIILESTTYPGTTEEVIVRLLETTGMKCGEHFFVAYSPERCDPGNSTHDVSNIPKIVAGIDQSSGDLAEALYATVVPQVIRLSSTRAAEAAKLTENIFRAVNIALVNELKVIFDKMEVSIWEVLDAAETKPFGFMRFDPGPGWGGHCIPVDPFYLSWKAKALGVTSHFIELAGELNRDISQFVLHKLTSALNDRSKPIKGSSILILGISYKKNVDDTRESPAFIFISELSKRGASITYHDPYVPVLPRHPSCLHLPQLYSQDLTGDLLAAMDAVLLLANHDAVDYALVERSASLIVDTRGVLSTTNPNVISA